VGSKAAAVERRSGTDAFTDPVRGGEESLVSNSFEGAGGREVGAVHERESGRGRTCDETDAGVD